MPRPVLRFTLFPSHAGKQHMRVVVKNCPAIDNTALEASRGGHENGMKGMTPAPGSELGVDGEGDKDFHGHGVSNGGAACCVP